LKEIKLKVVVASGNKNKVQEIREVLKDSEYEVFSMREAGIEVDIEETGSTFEENALIKARFVSRVTGETAVADDSGLEIDYLDKQPGILSSRFGGENTPYPIKNKMLLDKLAGVPYEKRTARFVCSMAAVLGSGEEIVVTRTIEGYIGYEEKGGNGFGYDPIFYVPEYNMTMAEMDIQQKNRISHRGKAMTDLAEMLKKRIQK
jgi:XTP/dITP diphosphohydrolase